MKATFQILSVLFAMVSLFFLLPLFVALYKGEALYPFLLPIAVLVPFFTVLFFVLRLGNISLRKQRVLSIRASFLVVCISWIGTALIGCIPFFISGAIPHFADAFFESMSGLTTTGASILTNIEALPYSILFWRSLTHWLGGMGIVVLTVAVLPMLGVDGVKLMQAESPGPTIDKTAHTIGRSAKVLWIAYLGLTVAEIILLYIGGMDFLDAITHTFGTLATGGFSTKNASIGYYTSPFIQSVITVFMVLAGINFALYVRLIRGNIRAVVRDVELRTYLIIFLAGSAIIAMSLNLTRTGIGQNILAALFQTATILTTTGYATEDYTTWPILSQAVLFLLMLVGGCAGSTGGGVKVIRLLVIGRQTRYSLKKLLYPRSITQFRIGSTVFDDQTVQSVSGFLFLYAAFALITVLVIASVGNSLLTSITGSLAVIGNIGPGFAGVGPAMNYSKFTPFLKIYLSFIMLLGRLELYTIILLFVRKRV